MPRHGAPRPRPIPSRIVCGLRTSARLPRLPILFLLACPTPTTDTYEESGWQTSPALSCTSSGERAFRDGKSALQQGAMSTSKYYVVGNNNSCMIQFKYTEDAQSNSINQASS